MIKLATIHNKKVEFIKELSPEDISSLNIHIERISALDKDAQKFIIFKQAYSDFLELLKDSKNPQRLSRVIMELMSTFKAFLDHWETSIKRMHGENSSFFKAFKALTSSEYDNCFAYRFTYELRNYIQHVSMPDFTYESHLNEQNSVEVRLLLNKSLLIKNYSKWKTIKKDFLNMPDFFDFIPLIHELYQSVKKINDLVINQNNNVRDLLYSSMELLKYKQFKIDDNSDLAIIEGEWDKPFPQTLDIKVLPLDKADFIVKNIKISK
jgi:hypothetical protein